MRMPPLQRAAHQPVRVQVFQHLWLNRAQHCAAARGRHPTDMPVTFSAQPAGIVRQTTPSRTWSHAMSSLTDPPWNGDQDVCFVHAVTRPVPDDLLTLRDVAERLGRSERTIRRWRREGLLPAVRIAGTVRVRLSDLERALKPDDGADSPKSET